MNFVLCALHFEAAILIIAHFVSSRVATRSCYLAFESTEALLFRVNSLLIATLIWTELFPKLYTELTPLIPSNVNSKRHAWCLLF